jgi:hypothetical protein
MAGVKSVSRAARGALLPPAAPPSRRLWHDATAGTKSSSSALAGRLHAAAWCTAAKQKPAHQHAHQCRLGSAAPSTPAPAARRCTSVPCLLMPAGAGGRSNTCTMVSSAYDRLWGHQQPMGGRALTRLQDADRKRRRGSGSAAGARLDSAHSRSVIGHTSTNTTVEVPPAAAASSVGLPRTASPQLSRRRWKGLATGHNSCTNK